MHISVSLQMGGNPMRFASLNFDANRAFERWQEIKRGSAPLSLEVWVMRDVPLEEYLVPRLVSLEFIGGSGLAPGPIPNSISQCTALQRLIVKRARTLNGTIPDGVSELRMLQTLQLQGNKACSCPKLSMGPPLWETCMLIRATKRSLKWSRKYWMLV